MCGSVVALLSCFRSLVTLQPMLALFSAKKTKNNNKQVTDIICLSSVLYFAVMELGEWLDWVTNLLLLEVNMLHRTSDLFRSGHC